MRRSFSHYTYTLYNVGAVKRYKERDYYLQLIVCISAYLQEHLWKYLVDLDGTHSATNLVREVQLVFSKSIPADIVMLTQQPFISESWRAGPNPRELEIVVYYKVKLIVPGFL